VGAVLEQLHGVDDGAGVLEVAQHFWKAAIAGYTEPAFAAALRAAQWAAGHLATEQGEEQLVRALQLVERMTPGPERARRELMVQLQLSGLLIMTRGYGAAEVGRSCARALELSREAGDTAQHRLSLWRLWAFHFVRADLVRAQELAQELLVLGERSKDQEALRHGHQTLGITALHDGRLAVARDHLERAVALGESLGDAAVYSRGFLALTRWLTGDHRAEALSGGHLGVGGVGGDPYRAAFALVHEAWLGFLRGDVAVVAARAEEAVAVSGERGFRLWWAMASVLGGWARAAGGDPEAGSGEVVTGLAALEDLGARIMRRSFSGLLADVHRRAGRPQEALAVVEEVLAEDEGDGERFYEAELHRLRGELLLALHPDRRQEAEACFGRALAVARSQGAATLATRAAANLADLVADHDSGTHARPATTKPAKRRPKRLAAQPLSGQHSAPDPSHADQPVVTAAAGSAGKRR
jgi:predicted ATPase